MICVWPLLEGAGGRRPEQPLRPTMAEEEAEVAPTKALVYASASFIGGHLCKALKAAGLEVDEATAQSDVLAADVIICSVYSKDPVRPHLCVDPRCPAAAAAARGAVCWRTTECTGSLSLRLGCAG